jgi:hypothetical protein
MPKLGLQLIGATLFIVALPFMIRTRKLHRVIYEIYFATYCFFFLASLPGVYIWDYLFQTTTWVPKISQIGNANQSAAPAVVREIEDPRAR